jgi:hypothetical protein
MSSISRISYLKLVKIPYCLLNFVVQTITPDLDIFPYFP